MTQAIIRGAVAGRPAVLATGAFGGRGPGPLGDATEALATTPDLAVPAAVPPAGVRSPDDADVRATRSGTAGVVGLQRRVEQRWALPSVRGDAGRARAMPTGRPAGSAVLWLRMREPLAVTAAVLAVLADFAPVAVSEALGRPVHVASLDNSIRLCAGLPPAWTAPRWVLLDAWVDALVRGVAQIQGRLFDADGRLLATAGQSAALRQPRS